MNSIMIPRFLWLWRNFLTNNSGHVFRSFPLTALMVSELTLVLTRSVTLSSAPTRERSSQVCRGAASTAQIGQSRDRLVAHRQAVPVGTGGESVRTECPPHPSPETGGTRSGKAAGLAARDQTGNRAQDGVGKRFDVSGQNPHIRWRLRNRR